MLDSLEIGFLLLFQCLIQFGTYHMDLENISINTAVDTQIDACHAIFMDSILGHYFGLTLAMSILQNALRDNELFVATMNNDVSGFYHVAKNGVFLTFPYLHLLAVKSSIRSQGIGALLLKHFEEMQLTADGFPYRPKTFLLVSKENPKAINFYERNGYTKQTTFDNMFAEGDTEVLMMKDLGLKKQHSNLNIV